jgi:hypothetical protein
MKIHLNLKMMKNEKQSDLFTTIEDKWNSVIKLSQEFWSFYILF